MITDAPASTNAVRPTASATRPSPAWPWLLAFAVLAFGFWGTRPLWEPDEGRYGEAAREMAVGGDWLVPRLQGLPHMTKPPLTYWAAAAGLKLTGVGPSQPIGNAWGARFYVALAFFGTILCVVALGRAWGWRESAARLSGLIYGTACLPFACGHVLSTDVLLTFLETLGVLCAWRAWNGQGRAWAWRLGFWAAFGLAFLTKGPPGLLPLLAIVAFAWMRREPPRGRLWSWVGLAVMLAIAMPWYVVIMHRMPEMRAYFLKGEVYNRVFTNAHRRSEPFWFYMLVFPASMTPWLHPWPMLVGGAWRRLWPGASGDDAGEAWHRRAWRRLVALEPPALFALLWVALPLAVFQVSKSKMPLYAVPLAVPLALWMGRAHAARWPGLLPGPGMARRAMLVAGVVWAAGLSAFVTCPDAFSHSHSLKRLGQAVAREMAGTDRVLDIYADDGVPQSIGFYSGVLLRERQSDRTDFLLDLQRRASKSRVLLLANENGIRRLVERGMGWKTLASQRQWRLVQVLPKGQAATPSIKVSP